MTEPSALSDAQLLARSHQWRLRAARGMPQAQALARALEEEIQIRFAGKTTLHGPLDDTPRKAPKQPLWRRFFGG